MTSYTLHKIITLWGLFLITMLSACGTTPSVEKNIREPEFTGMTIKEKETTLKPVFNLSVNTEVIYSIALSRDGRYIAFGRTNLVELWDTFKSGEGETIESGGMRDVTSLQFSSDGRFLAIGGYRTIEIWNISVGVGFKPALHKRIDGYGDYITTMTFSPDSRFLAAGSRGTVHSIRIWDVNSGREAKTLEWDWKYADEVKAIAFSHDGLVLASVAKDNIVRIWNLRTGTVEKSLNKDRTDIPVSIGFSQDNQVLTAGTAHGQVVLWRLSDGAVLRRIDAHKGSISSITFSKDEKNIISAGADQKVRLWDVATGTLRETKQIDQLNRRLMLTDDGQTLLAVNSRGISLHRLFEAGGMPPMIAILYLKDQQVINKPVLSISAKIVDNKGINDVVLELNGNEITEGDKGVRDLKIKPAGEKRELDLTWDLSLKRGANQITVIAYDTENLVARKSIEINYVEERGEVWGVVIGISQYKHIEGLRYADNDARAIYDYLTKDNGIPASHITFLANEEATLQRIKDVLGVEIKGNAREKDTVIIYFAGHGASEPDRDSPDGDGMEKYFLTYDSDPQRLYSTALPMQEMARMFSRIDSERIVLIQDTCYSGSSGGRTIQTASVRASISDTYLNRITKGKGRVIITASKANEVSMEKDSLGHGIFTYYLLEALRYGDNDHDGMITTGEIYRYVSEKVPEDTRGNQHPVKKGEEVEGEIVIGKVRGE